MMLFLISALFASFPLQASELRSATALTYHQESGRFQAELQPGFHFNDKAPNRLELDQQTVLPKTFDARNLNFVLPEANWTKGMATVYVCDDAVTFCETHRIDLDGTIRKPLDSTAKIPSKESNAESGKTFLNRKVNTKVNTNGFIQNNFFAAIDEAKRTQRLLLVDFSARWCPGCIRYEKEIFPSSKFKSLSKNFVKVNIDVDLFENFMLSEKFNIQGIPCLVVIDQNQAEIARLIDYQPLTKLQTFLHDAAIDKTPLAERVAKADSDSTSDLLKLSRRLLAANQFANAKQLLTKVTPPPPELLTAEVGLAKETYEKDSSQKENYAKALRQALLSENTSSRSLVWRSKLLLLLGAKEKEAEQIQIQGFKLANELLQQPARLKQAVLTDDVGEFTGYEKLLVAIYLADLTESAGMDSLSTWERAAEIGKEYRIPASKQGPALRYLIVLVAAKKFAAAELWVDKMLRFDPKSEDLKRRKLKILLAQSKYKKAITLGEDIITRAEGRIQFWIAESLAKAYLADKRQVEATALLQKYLARSELQSKPLTSVQKSMEELLKSIKPN